MTSKRSDQAGRCRRTDMSDEWYVARRPICDSILMPRIARTLFRRDENTVLSIVRAAKAVIVAANSLLCNFGIPIASIATEGGSQMPNEIEKTQGESRNAQEIEQEKLRLIANKAARRAKIRQQQQDLQHISIFTK